MDCSLRTPDSRYGITETGVERKTTPVSNVSHALGAETTRPKDETKKEKTNRNA